MLRAVRYGITVVTVGITVGVFAMQEPAEARCRMWEATHNGTDMFYASGAEGTAIDKLKWQVKSWSHETSRRNVRISKIKTACTDWFIKYGLPHKHCVAKAKVCYSS